MNFEQTIIRIERLKERIDELERENKHLKDLLDKWTAEHDPAILKMGKEIESLRRKCERYEKTLNDLASWREGEKVTGGFDEPVAAKEARKALEEGK